MRTAVCHMVEAADLARERRADLLQRLAGCFARRKMAAQAGRYIDGLTADLPRKNGWTLAEHAGDHTPDKMQRLLNHAVWDHQQAQQVYASSSSSTSPTRMRYWCSTSPARRRPAPTR